MKHLSALELLLNKTNIIMFSTLKNLYLVIPMLSKTPWALFIILSSIGTSISAGSKKGINKKRSNFYFQSVLYHNNSHILAIFKDNILTINDAVKIWWIVSNHFNIFLPINFLHFSQHFFFVCDMSFSRIRNCLRRWSWLCWCW